MRRLISWLFVFLLIASGAFVLVSQIDGSFFSRSFPVAEVTINGRMLPVEIAETPSSIRQGLSGRDSLPEDHGMLFLFPQADYYTFWMYKMKFSLDMVWIKNGRVVDIIPQVPVPAQDSLPSDLPRYVPQNKSDTILELNAGMAKQYQIELGDAVTVKRLSQTASPVWLPKWFVDTSHALLEKITP